MMIREKAVARPLLFVITDMTKHINHLAIVEDGQMPIVIHIEVQDDFARLVGSDFYTPKGFDCHFHRFLKSVVRNLFKFYANARFTFARVEFDCVSLFHNKYLSFFGNYIIPHFDDFVKTFLKKSLKKLDV
jgi:hypothetical protein